MEKKRNEKKYNEKHTLYRIIIAMSLESLWTEKLNYVLILLIKH